MDATANNRSLLLYDVVLVATLFIIIHDYSLFSGFHTLAFLLRYVVILLSLVLFGISLQKYTKTEILYVLFSLLLVLIVGYMSGWLNTLWLSYVVIIGARDVPFKHIVKLHLFSMGFFCLINMFAYEMGWTDTTFKLEEYRENLMGNVVKRKNFGYLCGTDFANHVIFILLDYWLLRDGRFRTLDYFAYMFIGYFILVNCDARLAVVCICMIICFSLIINYLEIHRGRISLLVKWFFVFSIPIFAILSLYSTFAYNATNLNWIVVDTIMSGRLYVSQETLLKYGIPLFGQSFVLYGTGNTNLFNEYDYVDSSYTQFYMRWGWIFTSLMIYFYYKIGKRAFEQNDVVLLLSLFLAGMSGVICQFLFHLGYCILLLALCASRYEENRNESKLIC